MTKDQNTLLLLIEDLCQISGLAGYETYVKKYIEEFLRIKKVKRISTPRGNDIANGRKALKDKSLSKITL